MRVTHLCQLLLVLVVTGDVIWIVFSARMVKFDLAQFQPYACRVDDCQLSDNADCLYTDGIALARVLCVHDTPALSPPPCMNTDICHSDVLSVQIDDCRRVVNSSLTVPCFYNAKLDAVSLETKAGSGSVASVAIASVVGAILLVVTCFCLNCACNAPTDAAAIAKFERPEAVAYSDDKSWAHYWRHYGCTSDCTTCGQWMVWRMTFIRCRPCCAIPLPRRKRKIAAADDGEENHAGVIRCCCAPYCDYQPPIHPTVRHARQGTSSLEMAAVGSERQRMNSRGSVSASPVSAAKSSSTGSTSDDTETV